MDELKVKLQSEIEKANWELINPHFQRDVVLYLKPENDLVQVAVLCALNKSHLIKGLMDAGELYKPTSNEVLEWSKDEGYKFNFLIVQPFVLIQSSISHDE